MILGVASSILVVVVICSLIGTRPPHIRARPITSASAPSSANLAPTKIRQIRRPAKLVQPILTALLKLQVVSTMPPAVQQERMLVEPQPAMLVDLENTMIKLEKLIAKIVERENTMIKRNAQQRLIAKTVELENIATKMESLIVNLIAMPDHTLYLTKVRVSFVRKVSGKVKMDSQIAKIVELGNTMIKRNAQQRLIVKLIATLDHTLYLTKVPAKLVQPILTALLELQVVTMTPPAVQ